MATHRGQSETLDTFALVAVIVTLTVSVGVLSLGALDTTSAPLLDVTLDGTPSDVTIAHAGGDPINATQLTVYLRNGTDTTQFPMEDATLTGDGDLVYETGESATRGHGLVGPSLRVLVVHGPTNSVLVDRTVDVTTPTGGPALAGNAAPTAAFTYSPPSPGAGQEITFDASSSADADGTITGYEWDWTSDGTYDATGKTANHTYESTGDHTVTLRVTDDNGATDTASVTISITDLPPTALFNYSPPTPGKDQPISFDAALSTDLDGSITSYEWDWTSDGTYDDTGEAATHTYSNTGTYTVTLRVTDDSGLTGTTTALVVVDLNQAPTPSFTYSPSNPVPSQPIDFDASGSSDPDGLIASYEWDWTSDGSYDATGETVEHAYPSEGDYNVTLKVTDGLGGWNTTTRTVSVSAGDNQLPTAAFDARTVDWYSTAWDYRKTVEIDHRRVAGNLSGFPVLIEVTDADLADHAQADAGDVVFTTDDGTTKLEHEVESYDQGSGHLVAWVEVPTVNATAPNTTVYMYYGDADAPDQGNASGVWDSDYAMVQHLDESSGSAVDSTDNGNDGIVSGADQGESGKIGTAYRFKDNQNDAVEVADDPTLDITDEVTISAWIRPKSIDDWNRIVAKSHHANHWPYTHYGLLFDDSDHLRMELADCATEDSWCQEDQNGATTVPTKAWTYATVTYDGSELRVYHDGDLDGSRSESFSLVTNDMPLTIGKSGYDADYYDGRIDEVRVSSTARSADWIATGYNNTDEPGSFYTVGAEESAYPVTVNGSASSDPDGSITGYEWDWTTDGTYDATGVTANHFYSGSGTYDVTLRVTDTLGAADSVTKGVTVSAGNAAPDATFTQGQDSAVAEEMVSFDATGSSDPDGSIATYQWDWTDDGSWDDTGATPTHEFETTGTHTVELRVTDDDGATATATGSVTVSATTFVDETSTANLGSSPGGGALVFADFDDDGYLDVFTSDDSHTSDAVRLRENDGDLTFSDHDSAISVDGTRGAGTGDFDDDGDSDLIVGVGQRVNDNQGKFNFDGSTVGSSNNEEALMFVDVDGDSDLDVWSPGQDYLWHENTESGWTSRTGVPGGPGGQTANGEGASAADIDADGDVDLIWAQGSSDVDVLENDGDGTYTLRWDVDGTYGLPENVSDHENMEWAWGDYDTDGDLDVYISGTTNEGLYENDGTGSFDEVTSSAGIDESDPDGAAWGDYDNDGSLDLILADSDGNSDLYDNDGDGTFTEVTATANLADTSDLGSTVGWFDADNDGDLDLVTNDPVRLWNNTRDDGELLRVIVRGNGSAGGSPLTPIGAQVDVYESGTGTLVGHRELLASQNQLQPPLRQHFGVDPTASYDVRVRFPSGAVVWQNDTVPEEEDVLVGDQLLGGTVRVREPAWSMFMGGPTNPGVTEEAGPTTELSAKWSTTGGNFGGFLRTGAVVFDDTVYVGNKNGEVYALHAGNGSVRWSADAGSEIKSTPAVRDGTVYVGTKAGSLLALSAATGAQEWSFPTNSEIRESSPTVTDDTVYVPTKGGRLYAVWTNGTERWRTPVPSGELHAAAAVWNDTVYVGDSAGDVYAFDAADGAHDWTFSEPSEVTFSSPSVEGGTLYVGDKGSKTLYAVDAATGSKEWEFAAGGEFLSTPAVADGTVYVGTKGGALYARDAATGDSEWTFTDPGEIHASPVVADGTVYVGDKSGTVYAVDAGTGSELVSFDTGAEIHSPVVVKDGVVYLGTKGGTFYAIDDGVLLADDFDRPDSNTLGNGWSETEAENDDAQITGDRLDFAPDNNGERPSIEHSFAERSSGKLRLNFTFNFERTAGENVYSTNVQLGDGDAMADPQSDHDQGVGVNLKWGGNDGSISDMSDEEGFGYTEGGSDTQIGVVSGADGFNSGGDATISVTVDLDANTYDIAVTGDGLISGSGTASNVPFENDVDVDTLRIFLDEVEPANFGDLEIDDVEVVRVE